MILPALLEQQRDSKREKLLQYAARIWDLHSGDEATRITAAIAKTREFFESLGVATRLAAYGVTAEAIAPVLAKLEQHGRFPLGERQDVTLDASRRILEASL